MSLRRIALLSAATVALVAVVGCGHPVERKLQGRWYGESVEGFFDGDLASATSWAKGTSLAFDGKRITVAVPGSPPRSGTFSVVGARRERIDLSVASSDGQKYPVRVSLEDESLRWQLEGRRAVLLRKAD